MRNLQKNLSIIWQPPLFLDKPPPFCPAPPSFLAKLFRPPISISFEKVEPPFMTRGFELCLQFLNPFTKVNSASYA